MVFGPAAASRADDAEVPTDRSGYFSDGANRSGYSYVREVGGDVFLVSRYNGRVEARRNLPISVGDEIVVSDGSRAEIGLADGNVLYIGGGTHARFESLRDQQGEDDSLSVINLTDGSVVLFATGDNADRVPRIDTEDATVYVNPGGRVRVNFDSRRGTAVIDRSGTAEVRAQAGSVRMRAGEYLQVRGEEEPAVERGSFSRDRFDIWVADRLETSDRTQSVSARYVDRQYSNDVVALDGYGDWKYDDEYDTQVWAPRVDAGWSPYSNGSWYYTPVGLTWWSYDPWGWYPFHYGSWFFNASWGRWCWRPAFVYSPAWVYWAYTPSYVGWCPIGSYSFWSPWYDNYYRRLNWYNRGNVVIAINGVFNSRNVDFHGWNFTNHSGFGTHTGRMDVIPGARVAERLGASTVAISSRPIVVNARPGEARSAIQSFVREAPRVIERTASADSSRLAPILARQRTLPASTLQAVEQRAVVVDGGRLAGPGIADVAPRGARVDRGATLADIGRETSFRTERGRETAGSPSSERSARGIVPVAPERTERGGRPEADRAPRAEADWRSRSGARSVEPRGRDSQTEARPERSDARTIDRPEARSDRSTVERSPREENWRSRSDIPPARRVIEGAVPHRRIPEAEPDVAPRARAWRDREPAPPSRELRPESRPAPIPRERDFRSESIPPARESRPEYRPAPVPREREFRPESGPPTHESRPEYRPAPVPRESRPESAPAPRVERAPAPAPPPPPPRAESHHAPPPDRGRKDN